VPRILPVQYGRWYHNLAAPAHVGEMVGNDDSAGGRGRGGGEYGKNSVADLDP
jgi:hypothetical protein